MDKDGLANRPIRHACPEEGIGFGRETPVVILVDGREGLPEFPLGVAAIP